MLTLLSVKLHLKLLLHYFTLALTQEFVVIHLEFELTGKGQFASRRIADADVGTFLC